jgi:hypothetical protein
VRDLTAESDELPEQFEKVEMVQVVGALMGRPRRGLEEAWHWLQILWQAPLRDSERDALRGGDVRVVEGGVRITYVASKTMRETLQLADGRAGQVAARRLRYMVAADVPGTGIRPSRSVEWLRVAGALGVAGADARGPRGRAEDLRALIREAGMRLVLPEAERRRWAASRASWRGLRSVLQSAALGNEVAIGEQLGHAVEERVAEQRRASRAAWERQLGRLSEVQQAYTAETPTVLERRMREWRRLVEAEVRAALGQLFVWGNRMEGEWKERGSEEAAAGGGPGREVQDGSARVGTTAVPTNTVFERPAGVWGGGGGVGVRAGEKREREEPEEGAIRPEPPTRQDQQASRWGHAYTGTDSDEADQGVGGQREKDPSRVDDAVGGEELEGEGRDEKGQGEGQELIHGDASEGELVASALGRTRLRVMRRRKAVDRGPFLE